MRITEPHLGRTFQIRELEDKLLMEKPWCTPDETFVYHLMLIGVKVSLDTKEFREEAATP